MSREDTFTGEAYQTKSNGQKLLTVPKKSGIEPGETIRAVSIGEYHDTFTRDKYPGHFIYNELEAISTVFREVMDDIPENHLEELDENHDLMRLYERIGNDLSDLMDVIDDHFKVVNHLDDEITGSDFGRTGLRKIVMTLRDIDQEIKQKQEELEKEYNVDQMKYKANSSGVDLVLKDGEEITVPNFYGKTPETVKRTTLHDMKSNQEHIDFMEKYEKLNAERKQRWREHVEEKGYDWNIESVSRDVAVYKIIGDNYVATLPFHMPSMDQVTIEKKDA